MILAENKMPDIIKITASLKGGPIWHIKLFLCNISGLDVR